LWGFDWNWSAAPGRDLVVVLDLSRSMLARDIFPSRVSAAKQAALDLSRAVEKRGGYRLALVAFASRAKLFCPLTHDYDHFRSAVQALDPHLRQPDLIGTEDESGSGTRIGAGLVLAVGTHDKELQGYQDILLISDGDDPVHDGEWRRGATLAQRRRMPVHTAGVGDPVAGASILSRDDAPAGPDNPPVTTKLEEQTLEEISKLTGGTYVSARTDQPALGRLFHDVIEKSPAYEQKSELLGVRKAHYAWFFAGALFFCCLQMTLAGSRESEVGGQKSEVKGQKSGVRSQKSEVEGRNAVIVALLAFLVVSALPLDSTEDLVREGNRLFEQGKFEQALARYSSAEELTTDPGLVAFNEGVVLYRLGRYRDALLHFRRSNEDAVGTRQARLLYNLANCLVHEANGRDKAKLREAIDCYDRSIAHDAAAAELRADATYNRELARTLLEKKDSTQDTEEPITEKPEPKKPDKEQDPAADMTPQGVEASGRPDHAETPAAKGNAAPTASDQQAPGQGNLPPIPDQDDLVPLTREDALQYLGQAAARIGQEQKEYRISSRPKIPSAMKDW
jgi:Ca-activated chloride channel family protein